MSLERTSLENRINSAGKNRIGDINLTTDILNIICDMYLEEYIDYFIPDMTFECVEEITDTLGIESYEAAHILFGEVCQIIRRKWEETPEGAPPDRQLLKIMSYLLPIRQEEKEVLQYGKA